RAGPYRRGGGPAGTGAQRIHAVRAGARAPGSGGDRAPGGGHAPAGAAPAAVRAGDAGPVRATRAAGAGLAAAARAPACAPGRRVGVPGGAAGRSASRARLVPGDRRRGEGACRAAASATAHLAAARTGAAARSAPAGAVRPGAAGKRLVGRGRRAPRLLRGAHRARPACLGVPCRRRARGRLDAARVVRMSWDDAIDGVDRETPGARVPRFRQVAWRLARREAGALEAANDDAPVAEDGLPAYAELHCLSEFSFLRGASSAEDLFARAAQCGYEALAITDECSLAGIVRAWEASRATGVKLIVGSEFALDCGLRCVLLVQSRAGYTRLCELITTGRRNSAKGSYRLSRADVERVVGQACPLERSGDTAGNPSARASSRPGSVGGKTRPAPAEPDLLATAGRAARGHADCGLFALWLPGTEPDPAQGRWLDRKS